MFKIYEVGEGETIDSIANKLNISREIITSFNGLSEDAMLQPGMYIVIPGEESVFERYIVQNGDNMYAIAQKYGITTDQLLKLNGIDENEYIYPNQEILVPKENTKFYITNFEDTLKGVTTALGASANELNDQNRTIYLVSDQLIVYKQ